MGFLGKDDLLKKASLKRATVKVGDGDEVVMRELSVADRLTAGKFFGEVKEGDTVGQTKAMLAQVAMSLCNEDGTQMCAGEEEVAIVAQALMDRSSRLVQDLINECLTLNGFGKEAIKEALGNSGEITTGNSSSGSPVISDTPAPAPSQGA